MINKNIIESRNDWTLDEVKNELRKVQSKKCRLQKQKERPDYEKLITEVLQEENELKEIKKGLVPAKMTVTKMTLKDIEQLTYEETIRAIKSIQSKKCLTQHAIDKTEYNHALEIEKMLQAHKDNNKPLKETVVSKNQIQALINKFEDMTVKQVKKDEVLKELNTLLDLNQLEKLAELLEPKE